MKFFTLMTTTLISLNVFANQAEVIGRVVIDENQTLTCMGTNCPPSTTYYQLVLDDAQVSGKGEVDHVVFEDFEKIVNVPKKPEVVAYGGVHLQEGAYVIIKASVTLKRFQEKLYAIVSNPEEVELAPVRYPVILY